jgi:hypothetical protein
MKQILTIICLILVTLTGYAQDKNFDLSNYKFPDYKRQELEFYLNSSGNNHYSHSIYSSLIPENETIVDDSKNSKFNGQFNSYFRYNSLSRRIIDQIYSDFSGSYNYAKQTDPNSSNKQTNPALRFSLSSSRKVYLKEDKLFIEGTFNISTSYSRDKEKSNAATSVYSACALDISPGIGIGLGRIEYVNDLWKGYYILEKLKEQHSLSRELKEQDISEFAQFTSQLNNKRFFDSRIRRIAELQALDSMLYAQKLIDRSDIRYFTTLNDYWSFPVYFDRKSGKELKLLISPELNTYRYKYTGGNKLTPTLVNLIATARFDYSKQINLFWERNFRISFTNTTMLSKNNDADQNYAKNLINSNISLGYGFFPDTRTRLTGSVSYKGYEIMVSDKKIWNNSIDSKLRVEYFISPQLQLTAELSPSYWFGKYNSTHGHNITYNLGLRYAIF